MKKRNGFALISYLLLSLLVNGVFSKSIDDIKPSCGYESCHPIKEDYVNVHIVPHSHDDVGWLKTVDQYYYGSNSSIQKAGVQYILDSVLDSLKKDRSRRFIYVETAFLWKWWIKQHDIVKSQFKKLINNGQLEIIGGAWSMNDEAATHYQSIIDQFTWGLRKLNESFGHCARPKIGWQIDPFGHSREMASIFSQLGFDGLFIGRIDYQDKKNRFNTSTAEMIWHSSSSLGNSSDIFTSVMYNTYSPPPGFCFDILCDDDPIIDNKKSPDYNVDKKVNDFFKYVEKLRKVYRTNNVLITMGNDFNYQYADSWFTNLDKLIRYGNERQKNGSKYNLVYSTPSCYLKAVYEESKKNNLKWMVKSDDFFPYASDEHSYWTGYFTSRPTIKRYERLGNNYLQVCKQLYALADLGPEDKADLNAMREAMGMMQHHDAITGTEKQHVASDYSRILNYGFEECSIAIEAALEKLSNNSNIPTIRQTYDQCHFNLSECPLTENGKSFVITVYNPLSRFVDNYVRLPVPHNVNYRVVDPKGNNVEAEIFPVPDSVQKIPGRKGKAIDELVFLASNIPPLGFKSFYVNTTKKSKSNRKQFVVEEDSSDGKVQIDDTPVSFSYNLNTGLLESVVLNGKIIPITQNFLYYRGTVGDNGNALNRSSGAYIFRPNGTETFDISKSAKIKVYKGSLISELRQTFNSWISQVIRIYRSENLIEFDWIVGPIPENDVNGKEIITRYITNLNSKSSFYTDSNGREQLKRVRNFRPTWKLNLTEIISSNYYPITTKLSIRDENQGLEVTVIPDRAQGGSSLRDGELELMLHRNCLYDDAFGVGEALREKAYGDGLVARGSHYLVSGSFLQSEDGNSLAAVQKDVLQRKLLSAWTFIGSTNDLTFEEYKAKYIMEFGGLTKSLPKNVQILTLEPWIGTSLLLRLEHVFELNEDSKYSTSTTLDLNNLFSPFEITSLRETTLGANEWIEDNLKLRFRPDHKQLNLVKDDAVKLMSLWMQQSRINSNKVMDGEDIIDDRTTNLKKLQITLKPMEIRTFVLDIKLK